MMTELSRNVRSAVEEWRNSGYTGASKVTSRLLQYWFQEEHLREDGTTFSYWRCQREAIEALIYLYEICGYDSLYSMAQGFDVSLPIDPTRDRWPKFCFRMATGSGKTFVMALAIVWQYFNSIFGTGKGRRYARHFLIVAPNLIVLDRLMEFQSAQIFIEWPFFVPDEWKDDFDFQVLVQRENSPIYAQGAAYVTNIQQFYEREVLEDERNPIETLIGRKPVSGEELMSRSRLYDLLARHENLLILNDEAHHVHAGTEWEGVIEEIQDLLTQEHESGLIAQLDFSATPITPEGTLFPHIVYEYTLGEAIQDQIVKRPHIGIIKGTPRPIKGNFVRKNQVQIDEGLWLHRRFKKEFKDTGKKPVLFVMCDTVQNADKVGAYLEGKKGYRGKVLVIHTYKRRTKEGFEEGDVVKDELTKIRAAAKEIDTNEFEIIVSVMMLKEGWDVKNVSVIVPLRAYQSNILVEQTLGRGLRRMFPSSSEMDEKVIVVEHSSFRRLWEAEIREKGLDIRITSSRKAYQPTNRISVDTEKLEFDMEIPILRGGITKVSPDLSKIDLSRLPDRVFRYDDVEIPSPRYIEKDLMSGEITADRLINFGFTERHDEYLSHIVKTILRGAGSSSQFADLVPLVKEYIEKYFFDIEVKMQTPEVTKKLNHLHVRSKIKEAFVNELQKLGKVETSYELSGSFKLSETEPLHTSNPVYPARKTVFDTLPYPESSGLEREFMVYLDESREVAAFTKILTPFPMRIPYYDREGILRHYLSDFLVRIEGGYLLIETKGSGFDQMESVARKDRAAKRWCENITNLTGEEWLFLKVLQEQFEQLKDLPFPDFVSNLES